ncbi:MAG: hypothetical protein M1819_001319 [Sarea resinae]|nr:MAG: hypothetical protein M1819_001319 [Sarea resinae]
MAATLDPQVIASKIKTLLNNQLKAVLKAENLPHSGVKSAMQGRLITQIQDYARRGNVPAFNRLKALVYSPDTAQTPGISRFGQSSSTPPSPSGYSMQNGSIRGAAPGLPRNSYVSGRLVFKDSPFYTILEPLIGITECPAMPSNRHTITTKVVLSAAVTEKLKANTSQRVMVYCAADSGLSPYSKLDIAFPHQVEIKINQDEVKANLRGLKNKPGSTRPADITDLIRKTPGYENSLVMTYALTTKRFSLIVNLVQKHGVDELVKKLRSGNVISKEKVIDESMLYVQDILNNTSRSVEQVMIEPNGTWSENAKPESSPIQHRTNFVNDGDDDELVEIHDYRVTSLKNEVTPTPALSRTPPSSSRSPSTASGAVRPSNNKRPIQQVIDLTFSDDEEEEPVRAPKRVATYNTPPSVSDGRSGYRPTNGVNLPLPKQASFRTPDFGQPNR